MNAQPRLTQAVPKSFPPKQRFPPSCQYDPPSLNSGEDTMSTMESIEVLVLPQVSDEVLHRIQNIDRRVKIIDARGWFDIELRATWPQWTVERYLGARTYPLTSLEERNRALASAQIVLTGWPLSRNVRVPFKWPSHLYCSQQRDESDSQGKQIGHVHRRDKDLSIRGVG
jgi:hypothetical protein